VLSEESPQGEVDGYRIGGYFRDHFMAKKTVPKDALIFGEPHFPDDKPITDPLRCAGGQKQHLDLAGMRRWRNTIPGWATLTLDGRWLSEAHGPLEAYYKTAEAHIEALPDSAWLVTLDCHW
jgi:hypothetical protein